MQIEHNPKEPPHGAPSLWSVISYLIAAAILMPVGWWLKEHLGLADWLRSIFQ
jgi:hypothetical protein